MTAAGSGPGPEPGDQNSSTADENPAFAGQTSGATPGPSTRTGLSTSQAGPVGPCPSGRNSLEAGSNKSVMASFLGCFGVTNALEPPKPRRPSSASLTVHTALPPLSQRVSGTRHLIDSLSDASSYDADSDESSNGDDHERTAEDSYEVAEGFIDDFIRDLSVEERQEQRPPSPEDHVSRAEFDAMQLEYLERLVEQSEESQASLEKVNALNAELLVQRNEQQAATDRFARIASALQCSICLDTFAQPRSLACGHVFCQDCLLQWLERNPKCPACRAHVSIRPAPAYAIKEVVALLNPHDSTEPSSTGGETTDPWARLFPVHCEHSIPRRTPAASGVDLENETAALHARYRRRLAMLLNNLNRLTRSELWPSQGDLPAQASRPATHETNVAAAASSARAEGADTEAVNYDSVALVTAAIARQIEAYQDYLSGTGASTTSGISQESLTFLRHVMERSMDTVFGSVRHMSLDIDEPLPQRVVRRPPRPERMSTGPTSSPTSSPRIPIHPPRERPSTRPARPATEAAPGPSHSPSIPIPPLSRLRQPTRFVRPEGTPAATTATAASGSSARNPIRISHIMNNSHSGHDHPTQTAAVAGAGRLLSRENTEPSSQVLSDSNQALSDSNRRMVQSIRRLLLSYQRLNDLNAVTELQSTTRRAIYPARRITRDLDRTELPQPSDAGNDEPDHLSARISSLRHRLTESLQPATGGSGESPTATAPAPRAAALLRPSNRPYRSLEESAPTPIEAMRPMVTLREHQQSWRSRLHDTSEPSSSTIRVRRPLSVFNGRHGYNARYVYAMAPARSPRQTTQSLEEEPEDTFDDLLGPE
ncbi:E3 ubiquitin ligase [Coemansia sp. RSA 2337]|nr:E3 ubiquitin ligase [Coemansia sp. RSA 2337]